MSQAVIDYFEFVDVDEQNREFEITMATADGESALKTLEQQGAIGQTSQAIVQRIVRQRFLGTLAICDVAVYDYQAVGFAICVANDIGGGFQNAPRTIFVPHSIFESFSATSKTGFSATPSTRSRSSG